MWVEGIQTAIGLLESPYVFFVQLHGVVPCILLGTLWILSSSARNRELVRRVDEKKGETSARPHGDPDRIARSTAIVVPIRGYRTFSIINWKSIIGFDYDGPLKYIFVVEDKEEVALPVLNEIIVQEPRATVLFSGRAAKCSQKIHNLVHGIRHARDESDYIICMDDDVQPHPGFVRELVYDLEHMPDIRIATAYPFDVVQKKNGSIFSYATLAYHLPLSIGLSLRDRTRFVWGGCMVFRSDDMKQDRLGIMAAWLDGGYSDDLTVAARVNRLNMDVFCPSYAIFPQWIEKDVNMMKYWNYLRRQLFVIDTYADMHNKCTNYSLACLLVYGCLGFIGPTVTIYLRYLLLVIQCLFYTTFSMNEEIELPSHRFLLSSVLFIVCFVYMFYGLKRMVTKSSALLGSLHEDMTSREVLRCFSWWRVMVGFWLAYAIAPFCLLYTFMTSHINWSGIEYYRRHGKIVQVCHGPNQSH